MNIWITKQTKRTNTWIALVSREAVTSFWAFMNKWVAPVCRINTTGGWMPNAVRDTLHFRPFFVHTLNFSVWLISEASERLFTDRHFRTFQFIFEYLTPNAFSYRVSGLGDEIYPFSVDTRELYVFSVKSDTKSEELTFNITKANMFGKGARPLPEWGLILSGWLHHPSRLQVQRH